MGILKIYKYTDLTNLVAFVSFLNPLPYTLKTKMNYALKAIMALSAKPVFKRSY